MFHRNRQKRIALIALVALLMAVFMPSMQGSARAMDGERLVALGGICSAVHGAADPAAPGDVPSVHQHCVFCVSHVPFVPASAIATWVTLLEPPAAHHPPDFDSAWPHRAGALHPLSPRAPPRAA